MSKREYSDSDSVSSEEDQHLAKFQRCIETLKSSSPDLFLSDKEETQTGDESSPPILLPSKDKDEVTRDFVDALGQLSQQLAVSQHSDKSQSLQEMSGEIPIAANDMLEDPLLSSFPDISLPKYSNSQAVEDLNSILDKAMGDEQLLSEVVDAVLRRNMIRSALVNQMGSENNKSFKKALSQSKLTEFKKYKEYLLGISPLDLCVEFQTLAPTTFNYVCRILLGLNNPQVLFESQFLLNSVCCIYSILARAHNRNAIGYLLKLGVAVKDGGLREESFKALPLLPHIRTVKKYDSVLAGDLKDKLKVKLKEEREYFRKKKDASLQVARAKLIGDESVLTSALNAHEELDRKAPKLLTTVWDNINIRSGSRYERSGDNWSDRNKDYMASIHIKERIDVNHLDSTGHVKSPDLLNIEDFCLGDKEYELLFCNLIVEYSSVLVRRYPMLFQSLNGCIKDFLPHQFQEEMCKKSEEYTGNIYEKSESKMDELIQMMIEYQKEMALVDEDCGSAFVRRQLSGDQKTEKNSHHAILSKSDEPTPEDRLSFILPAHEYLHQMFCMCDISSELFRDETRGLDGGAFSVATLLNRKKAKVAKGKDDYNSLKDFLMIKAEARFAHYFLAKYGLDPSVDNTPHELRSRCALEKVAYIHGLVKDALHDLLPQFKKCTGILPNLKDFPATCSTTMEDERSGVCDAPSSQPSLSDASVSSASQEQEQNLHH